MDWHWAWLTVAAFLAGVLNAVAGGGSFLLFPAMLSMKMLPVQANATNTVALWPGQLTSVAAYREDIRKNRRLVWPMGLAGLLGGTAGALVLLNTPQLTFLHLCHGCCWWRPRFSRSADRCRAGSPGARVQSRARALRRD